ncbi:hypothetical protein [Thalassolituus oleivorans]|uniref:hypothetical protein n=1 Tax=Thalassolituus oleivorans TaxID=187493 RepID=UPI0023F42FA1|nr:hypothetical protein [Thalassolituus oleivorans]
MPKDALEIIDTAVKIGLGALITGVSSYLLANRNYKNERLKVNLEQDRLILKEIAVDFENANNGTNQFVIDIHDYHFNKSCNLGDLSQRLAKSLLDSTSHIEKAMANSNLLGLSDIFTELTEYLDILNKLHTSSYNISEQFQDYIHSTQERLELIKNTRDSIYPKISQAYIGLNG